MDLSPHSTGCALTACSQTGFADWLPGATRLGPGDRGFSLGSFWFFVGLPLREQWCASGALKKEAGTTWIQPVNRHCLAALG